MGEQARVKEAFMAGVRLGDILVEQGVITQDQLADGLRAQRHFGGRLGSVLVELGFLTEEQLAMALSRQLSIPYITAADVAAVPDDIVSSMSTELVEKYRVVPIRLEERTLLVGLADPGNLTVLDELGFSLGCKIKPVVITEISLNYAMHRYYGVTSEARFITLSAEPSVKVGVVHVSDRAPGPGVTQRAQFFNAEPGAYESPQAQLSTEQRLADVRTKKDVIHHLCRELGKSFERLLLLELSRGRVHVVEAVRTPAPKELVMRLQASVESESVLADLCQHPRLVHRERMDDAALATLCAGAQMEPSQITLMPVMRGREPVFVAVGQGADVARIKESGPGITAYLAKVSLALEIVRLREQISSS